MKCLVSDCFDIFADLQMSNAPAVEKSSSSNFCDSRRDGDARKTGASLKDRITDFCDALRDCQTLKTSTGPKSTIADFFDTWWDIQTCKTNDCW